MVKSPPPNRERLSDDDLMIIVAARVIDHMKETNATKLQKLIEVTDKTTKDKYVLVLEVYKKK